MEFIPLYVCGFRGICRDWWFVVDYVQLKLQHDGTLSEIYFGYETRNYIW